MLLYFVQRYFLQNDYRNCEWHTTLGKCEYCTHDGLGEAHHFSGGTPQQCQ